MHYGYIYVFIYKLALINVPTILENNCTQLSVINKLPLFHISATTVRTLKSSTSAIFVLVTIDY